MTSQIVVLNKKRSFALSESTLILDGFKSYDGEEKIFKISDKLSAVILVSGNGRLDKQKFNLTESIFALRYQNLNILLNSNLCITGCDNMITCDVCGHLNSQERATCANCGSDLSDSPDWDIYDIDDFGDDMLTLTMRKSWDTLIPTTTNEVKTCGNANTAVR